MFGGKALGWMSGTLIWVPGTPGKRTLSTLGACDGRPSGPALV